MLRTRSVALLGFAGALLLLPGAARVQSLVLSVTTERGHARLPDRSARTAAAFVAHALRTFTGIAGHARVKTRLLGVDRPTGSVAAAADSQGPQVEQALGIFRAPISAAPGAEAAA